MLCTFWRQSLLQMPVTYFIHMGLRLMENNNIVNDLLLSSAHPRNYILQCWSTNDKLRISSTLCQLKQWLVLYMQQWLRRWSTHVWRYVLQLVVNMFTKALLEKKKNILDTMLVIYIVIQTSIVSVYVVTLLFNLATLFPMLLTKRLSFNF